MGQVERNANLRSNHESISQSLQLALTYTCHHGCLTREFVCQCSVAPHPPNTLRHQVRDSGSS
jgi:hypothetical protein